MSHEYYGDLQSIYADCQLEETHFKTISKSLCIQFPSIPWVTLSPCWEPFEILSHFLVHQIDFPQLNNILGNDWPWLVEVGVVADHTALIDGLMSHVWLENRPLITRQRWVIYRYIYHWHDLSVGAHMYNIENQKVLWQREKPGLIQGEWTD